MTQPRPGSQASWVQTSPSLQSMTMAVTPLETTGWMPAAVSEALSRTSEPEVVAVSMRAVKETVPEPPKAMSVGPKVTTRVAAS